MSGLAGVFDPTGRPIDRDAFARMASHLAARGPDGVRCWHAPHAAMAFARFIRTPDAAADRQPLDDPDTGICVTFDGRLDNREELAAALDVRVSDRTPDSTLAAGAYRRWGAECAAKLLGDFSLVVWDGRGRRLFAARDILGVRPLFYRELRGAWWWASDQQALVTLDRPAINEGYVGEHLSGRIASVDETIYEGIHRLPMAHALILGGAGARRWRYWRPDPDARLACRDHRDYEHHFRTLAKEAVRARLRIQGRAALLLSGGIDSSSVAVQIAELRRDGHQGAQRTSALSMTIPGSEACEGPVIRQVLARLGLPGDLLPGVEPGEEHFAADAASSLDLPESPSSSLMQPLYDAAVAGGCTVVLTGYGGDDWFEPSFGELGDLLRRGRIVASGRWLAEMARVPDQIRVSQMARHGAWLALPPAGRRIVRRALRRDPVPGWIDRRFARRNHLADRLRQVPDDVPFQSIAQYDIFRAATGGEAAFLGDQEERGLAARGLEQRHPLMDRRLVEFALALPSGLRCGGGVSKAVMRQAMSGLLPAGVTATPRNDDFGFLGLRALARLGGADRLAAGEPVSRGWVSARAMADLYRRLQGGDTACLWPLCAATSVDFWLRALADPERGRPVRDDGRQPLQARA